MTRAELYDLVWLQPLKESATRLGISASELRAICKEYAVPLPPKGYWTKEAWDREPPRQPLPSVTPSLLSRINSGLKRLGGLPLRIADSQLEALDLKVPLFAGDATADTDRRTQTLVEALSAKLNSIKPDAEGFVTQETSGLPSVRVGQATIGRAIVVFRALLMGITQSGYETTESPDGFRIAAEGELFAIRLIEARERTNFDSRQKSRLKSRRPSGRLRLEIVDLRPLRWSDTNIVGVWYDAPTKSPNRYIRLALRAIASTVVVIQHVRARREAPVLSSEASVISGTRAGLASSEELFLLQKAEDFTRLVRLEKLAEYYAADAAADSNEPENIMARSLHKFVKDLRNKFEASSLRQELYSAGLFLPPKKS